MSAAETSRANSFVLLRAGDRCFALPARIVAELAPPLRLHVFPHTSPLVAGVIVRRGRIVPVYDAVPALAGGNISAQRFFLIAQCEFSEGSELSAIPVDGEGELATGEMEPPPPGLPKYVMGTLAIGGESVEVLDFGALIASQSAGPQGHGPEEAQR
ncbi:MAG: chemotaxis protein CheW [Candidatus Acidiferrales bacterium]